MTVLRNVKSLLRKNDYTPSRTIFEEVGSKLKKKNLL
jgi:hypothetical protein